MAALNNVNIQMSTYRPNVTKLAVQAITDWIPPT